MQKAPVGLQLAVAVPGCQRRLHGVYGAVAVSSLAADDQVDEVPVALLLVACEQLLDKKHYLSAAIRNESSPLGTNPTSPKLSDKKPHISALSHILQCHLNFRMSYSRQTTVHK